MLFSRSSSSVCSAVGKRTPHRQAIRLPHPSAQHSMATLAHTLNSLKDGQELDDQFTGLPDAEGMFTVAGFGSLLSQQSARNTFPLLTNFRPAVREVSSLSLEAHPGSSSVVSLFEVPYTPDAVQAFINREHEFRFCSVKPLTLSGQPTGRDAVVCTAWNDADYRARRCGPEEWQRRWGVHGIERVWGDPTILPCRVYLRHCVLAARAFCEEADDSFQDQTFLADRKTTVREWLSLNPEIMGLTRSLIERGVEHC